MNEKKIDVRPEDLKNVREILRRHLDQDALIWVFGSRVTGRAKRFSDLDLAIDASKPLSMSTMASLANDFEESDLPYKVDIVDWNAIDESFREVIRRERTLI